jgi:hypothetical protein
MRLELVKRKLSVSAEGAACRASQTQAEERAAELKDEYPTAVAAIDAALKHAREHKDAEVKALGYLGGTRDVAALEKAVKGHFKARQGAWEQARDKLARIAKDGEAAAKRAKVAGDFGKLDDLKEDAAETRKPLDEVLAKFAADVTKIIPGARFGYRGSLARGVKSPSKFTKRDNTFSMAHYDSTGVRQAKSNRPAAEQTNPVSYDCDAYIEVPDEKFADLQFEEGPLRNTPVDSAELQALKDLEARIDAAIKAQVKPLMPGLDTSEKFELFLSSTDKVAAQFKTGVPYPTFMLEQEFPHLAGAQGTFSMEPIRKLREYITDVVSHNGYVFPLNHWEPFFRKLYEHVCAKGPTAIVLPEVQVDLTSGAAKERTAKPAPRPAQITGPYDVVKELKFVFARRPQTKSDLAEGRVVEGTVQETQRGWTYIDLGVGDGVCAKPHSRREGVTGLFTITGRDDGYWILEAVPNKPQRKR